MFVKKYPATTIDKTKKKIKVEDKKSSVALPNLLQGDNVIFHKTTDTMVMRAAQAGKGDSPRNCFSNDFLDNYQAIDWHRL